MSTPSPIAPARFDYTVMVLAALQAGLALIYLLRDSGRGYYETDASAWVVRCAWRLMDMEFLGGSLLGISVIALIGATRPAWKRRGWYFAALIAMLLEMLIWWAVAAALKDAHFSYRWVSTYYGPPQPQSWTSHWCDPALWWQGPVMMLIVNPACLTLLVRCVAGRAIGTGTATGTDRLCL